MYNTIVTEMPQIFHRMTNFVLKYLQLKDRIVGICHKMLGKNGIVGGTGDLAGV